MVLFILMSTPVYAQEQQLLRSTLTAYTTVSIIDAAQTFTVLHRGGVESNPLLATLGRQNPIATTALLGAGDVATLLLWKKVHHTHSKLALAALIGSTAFRAYVVQHNFKTLTAMRR